MPKNTPLSKKRKGDELDKPLNEVINDFKKIESPNVADIGKFMVDFLTATHDLDYRLQSVEGDVEELRGKHAAQQNQLTNIEERVLLLESAHENGKKEANENYKKLDAKVDKLTNTVTKNRTEINFMHQKNLDNDIILKNFPAEPNVTLVFQNFSTLFKIEKADVRDYYYVKYINPKVSDPKPQHFVVISFKAKSKKMETFQLKKANGPVLCSQLDPGISTVKNPIITCTNRLSKFNLLVLNTLYGAKEHHLIYDFRYHNCLYQLKRLVNDNWTQMATYDDILPLKQKVDAIRKAAAAQRQANSSKSQSNSL